MNIDLNEILLAIAVFWPLLLAIPAVITRLPLLKYLAIIPAAILLFLPGEISLEMPWLFMGSGFTLDINVKIILAMVVISWLIAAYKSKALSVTRHSRETVFYLLTLSGVLGATLSADLIAFFCFSSVMSYSFYSLLTFCSDKDDKPFSKLYLVMVIIADIALFEAILLAASVTGDLRYEIVSNSITGSYLSLYLFMVIIGFSIKAGVWPFHFWISSLIKASNNESRVLLGSVPVAMSMLGLIRFVQPGELTDVYSGGLLLIIGSLAVLTMVVNMFKRSFSNNPLLHTVVLITGIFSLLAGAVLIVPDIRVYETYLGFSYIAIAGLVLGLVGLFAGKPVSSVTAPNVVTSFGKASLNLVKNMSQIVETGFELVSQKRIQLVNSTTVWLQQVCLPAADRTVSLLSSWKSKITLLVVVGLTITYLGH